MILKHQRPSDLDAVVKNHSNGTDTLEPYFPHHLLLLLVSDSDVNDRVFRNFILDYNLIKFH